jgi:hypothetical protein
MIPPVPVPLGTCKSAMADIPDLGMSTFSLSPSTSTPPAITFTTTDDCTKYANTMVAYSELSCSVPKNMFTKEFDEAGTYRIDIEGDFTLFALRRDGGFLSGSGSIQIVTPGPSFEMTMPMSFIPIYDPSIVPSTAHGASYVWSPGAKMLSRADLELRILAIQVCAASKAGLLSQPTFTVKSITLTPLPAPSAQQS